MSDDLVQRLKLVYDEIFVESDGVPGGIRGILRQLALTQGSLGERLSTVVDTVLEHDKFNAQIRWLAKVSKPIVIIVIPLLVAALGALLLAGLKVWLTGSP